MNTKTRAGMGMGAVLAGGILLFAGAQAQSAGGSTYASSSCGGLICQGYWTDARPSGCEIGNCFAVSWTSIWSTADPFSLERLSVQGYRIFSKSYLDGRVLRTLTVATNDALLARGLSQGFSVAALVPLPPRGAQITLTAP